MITVGGKEYYTVSDVSALLKVTVPTVRNWTRQGHVKSKRHPFNKFRLYEKKEIEKLVHKLSKL